MMCWGCRAGPIHFVSYSTEESVAVGSPQYNFLAADLATVDRCLTPWVIANGHRPVSPPHSGPLPTLTHPVCQPESDSVPLRLAQRCIV